MTDNKGISYESLTYPGDSDDDEGDQELIQCAEWLDETKQTKPASSTEAASNTQNESASYRERVDDFRKRCKAIKEEIKAMREAGEYNRLAKELAANLKRKADIYEAELNSICDLKQKADEAELSCVAEKRAADGLAKPAKKVRFAEPAADWAPFTLSEQKGQQAIYALMRLSITSRDRWGLDPSMPFDKWFKVVCAAKHEGLPMRYVEEWSRSGGDKFDAKALATIRRVYQEVHPTGRVGAGTVIMLYREQAPARAPPPAPLALDLFDGDTAFERALVEATDRAIGTMALAAPLALDLFDGDTAFERALVEATDRAIGTMALAASPSAYLTRELTAADLRTPEQHQMSAKGVCY